MYITKLTLRDFRNYESAAVSFLNGTNLIYGNNAQGKTNLLEAVFLFCTGRSHRRATDREMIREGTDWCEIDIEFCDEVRDYTGQMKILDGKKKFVAINKVPVKKISQIADYINVVMFSPEDLSIIKTSPSERRRFVDMALSQLSPVYVSVLNEYLKILKQRNNLLKEIKRNRSGDDTLDVWDEYLIDLSCKIIAYRRKFLEDLMRHAVPIHREIAGEALAMQYESNCCEDVSNSETLWQELEQKIKKGRRRDIETGTSNTGAHRDDFLFSIDGRDARLYGSQGQQRSVVLSLKLALTEVIRQSRGTYPVILLDDIMSELDESRRQYLAGKIRGKQVILTCTDRQEAAPYGTVRYFYVNNNTVTEA